MEELLTVVIPCKNEGINIINCVNCLLDQSVKFSIVIADASDYSQPELKYLTRKENRIKVVRGGTPSIGRNRGFDHVKTPYVLFLDADMVIKDNSLIERCLSYAKEYDLISCNYACVDKKYDFAWSVFAVIQKILRKPFVMGGFQLWKCETFTELGKFDESVSVGEDWLLSKKLSKNRVKILKDKVHTSSRRFEKKGLLFMIFFILKAYVNSKNKNWFKTSHNYW